MIALWSGSSPGKKKDIQTGLRTLEELDWPVLTPKKKEVRQWAQAESAARKFLATSDKEKLESLLAHLKNPQVKNIFCTRGGYGVIRCLHLLDKKKLDGMDPKRIWGYSDTTILQYYFYQRFGWSWVHSPMLCSESLHKPLRIEKKAWHDIHPKKSFKNTQQLKIISQKKTLSAKKLLLLGGNLACLTTLIGTPWEPEGAEKHLLFLEDIGEAPYKIDRYLQHLLHSKMFHRCKGVVLGHFTRCPGALGVLKKWADENKLFLAQGLRAGHESPHLPMPMGEKVSIGITAPNKISMEFPVLSF